MRTMVRPSAGAVAAPDRRSGGDSDEHFAALVVAAMPDLRAFARFLAHDPDFADDLVQETVAKALAAQAQFTPGTRLGAWLFTILRNHFYSRHRRRVAAPAFVDPDAAGEVAVPSAQEACVALADLRRALALLAPEQREALVLVCARGLSHAEAARICECAVGTIKSRVSRARAELRTILDGAATPA